MMPTKEVPFMTITIEAAVLKYLKAMNATALTLYGEKPASCWGLHPTEVLAGCREPKIPSDYELYTYATAEMSLSLWLQKSLNPQEIQTLSLSLSEIGSDLPDREILVVTQS